jgi:predicted small lipoprotein YifL
MRRSAVVVLLIFMAGAMLAACSKKGGYDFPPPPSTIPDEQTTVPDFSSVQLARVAGRTTTMIDNAPGQAHISGFVVAPQGAVPGATVHAERLVGDAVLALDVATNPDGSFHIDNVQGGRYRLRAWRAPDLALTTPIIFFLNGNENKTGLNLQVNQYTGTNVAAVIAPNPPAVGDPANLAVQVTSVVVDPTGTVRATPMVNVEVDLQGAGSWQLQSSSAEFTDTFGQATWRLTCTATGVQPLSATVNTANYPLNVPACGEPLDTTPSPESPSTTSATPTTARRTTTTG